MLKQAKRLEANDAGAVEMVSVPKADLVEAWKLIEAMAVSMATIGRCFGQPASGPADADAHRDMLDAIDEYLCPELFQRFNKSRARIGERLSRPFIERLAEESEDLADFAERLATGAVPYWTYDGFEQRRPHSLEERYADREFERDARDTEE